MELEKAYIAFTMGRKWNGIELGRRVGGGLTADVYAVEEGGHAQALKVVDLDDERPPHSIRNEIKILNRLAGCPNVSEMTRMVEGNGEVGIMMPLFETDLAGVISAHTKRRTRFGTDGSITYVTANDLGVDQVRDIMDGLLRGLEWTHRKGIIHRDINPSNIMFAKVGDLKSLRLIDYGIGYAIPNNNGLERDDMKYSDIATGFYKAPELLLSKRDYGTEVDMWAAGIVLAQLGAKSGKVPFEEDAAHSDLVLLSQILRVFGSPPANWEECCNLASFEAMNRSFFTQEGVPAEEIIDNVTTPELVALFKGLTKYTKRLSAGEALEILKT